MAATVTSTLTLARAALGKPTTAVVDRPDTLGEMIAAFEALRGRVEGHRGGEGQAG